MPTGCGRSPRRVDLLCVFVLALCTGCGSKPEEDRSNTATPPQRTRERQASPADTDRKPAGLESPSAATAAYDDSSRPTSNRQIPKPGPRRPPDSRMVPDDDALALRGIRRYESKRLTLYSDVPAERVRHLPQLTDALYDELERYFGPLPPDEAQSDFQMTGFVMADPARFEASGVVPVDLPPIRHGRHRGAEFWMKDQSSDYYLAHLLLHEATHCFMTIIPNPLGSQPWYIEGMAEMFATHRSGSPARFGVFPDDPGNFVDLGRIRLIRDAVTGGNALFARQVMAFQADDYLSNPPYAWSWALCWFLANHPETRDQFRQIENVVDPADPMAGVQQQFSQQQYEISQGFWMFSHDLCHGYDLERAAIRFDCGVPLNGNATTTIRADRGWQSSKVYLQQGEKVRVTSTGRFIVGQSTKPWESEPQGITLRYVEGVPLGTLLGTIREETPGRPAENLSMRVVSALGREVEWTSPASGTLYLRVNDAWNSLSDNSGDLTVTITPLP